MRKHILFYALLGAPFCGDAQPPTSVPSAFNASTLAVLVANQPDRFTEEQWLRMMQEPVNRSLSPLHIAQAMLDTLDGTQLDMRFMRFL